MKRFKMLGSSLIIGFILLLSLSAPAFASEKKIADISQYQGDINWKKASKELDFVIIGVQKGSKGDPNYRIDTKFKQNTNEAIKHNVPFGQYAFGQFTSKKDARNEAIRFYNRSNDDAAFYALDNEQRMAKAKGKENTYVKVWYDTMRSLTDKPLVYYSGEYFAKSHKIDYSGFDGAWIANYSKQPQIQTDLWQYTSNGRIKGIPNRVDLNRMVNADRVSNWFTNPEALEEEAE